MANVVLETRTEQDYQGNNVEVQEVLAIEPRHYDGVYKVCVTKETHKGYMKEFMPLANGNFNVRLATGRKSQKKLDKLEALLERHKNLLTDLWQQGKYQDMVEAIQTDVRTERLFVK